MKQQSLGPPTIEPFVCKSPPWTAGFADAHRPCSNESLHVEGFRKAQSNRPATGMLGAPHMQELPSRDRSGGRVQRYPRDLMWPGAGATH